MLLHTAKILLLLLLFHYLKVLHFAFSFSFALFQTSSKCGWVGGFNLSACHYNTTQSLFHLSLCLFFLSFFFPFHLLTFLVN